MRVNVAILARIGREINGKAYEYDTSKSAVVKALFKVTLDPANTAQTDKAIQEEVKAYSQPRSDIANRRWNK